MKKVINQKINYLVKKYKTNNPFELAELLNIHTLFWDFPEEVNGLYQYEKREKFIYINSSLDSQEKLFVCGHELGHAILHPKLNCTFIKTHTYLNLNKYEKEANLFAADLLIPANILEDYPGFTLEQISNAENIPLELLKLKFM